MLWDANRIKMTLIRLDNEMSVSYWFLVVSLCLVFFHIQASTCAGFCDSWVGLLGTEMFTHHFLEWTHEYWDKAVNVAGIVTARWFQDHQCSWKTNKFNRTPKIKQILRVEWQVTDKLTSGKSFLPFTEQDIHFNRPRQNVQRAITQ